MPVPKATDETINFLCKGSGATAKGFVSTGGFTVLEGSTVSDHIVPSLETRGKTYYNLRNALVKDGIIVNRVFTRDYEFNAPARDLDYGKKYENLSNQELYDLLLKKDPNIDREKLHPNNRKRVLRALEVKEELDLSIHSFNHKNEALYDYFIVYLSLDREVLYERINKRVDMMVSDGLIDEVKALYDDGIYPHAIGYQELVPYFDHDITLESAIEEIKKNTRHLAKRQETWFRHQMDSHFYTVDLDNIENTINQIIKDVDGWLK